MDNSYWKSSFDFVFLVCKERRCFLIKYKVSFFHQITPPPPKKTVSEHCCGGFCSFFLPKTIQRVFQVLTKNIRKQKTIYLVIVGVASQLP